MVQVTLATVVSRFDSLSGRDDEWHTLLIGLRGTKISLSIDGRNVATSEHAQVTAGRVGFVFTNARWRNLEIRHPDGQLLWKGWPSQPIANAKPAAAPLRAKTPSPPADPFQRNSVWTNGTLILTVTERLGESYRARIGNGGANDVEITGIVKDGKVTWLAKDMRSRNGVSFEGGFDSVGTLSADQLGAKLDLIWGNAAGQTPPSCCG